VLIAGGAVTVLAVVGFAGWWFFIRDDAPKKATIDDASKTLDEGAKANSSSSGNGSSSAGVDGDWKVDPDIGSFDKFTSTFAGYRIKEKLATIGGTTAVGRTPDVTGGITIAGKQVTTGSITVDMTTLTSDQDRRDNAIRSSGLETDTFKTATFKVTKPIALPANATSGAKITFSATGDLTLHGVTKPVTIRFDARYRDGEIVIVGNTPIHLSDYNIDPPTNFMALSVSGNGTLEFQVFLKKG
jgi:polyisoprenoid-binding protein YceI